MTHGPASALKLSLPANINTLPDKINMVELVALPRLYNTFSAWRNVSPICSIYNNNNDNSNNNNK